MPRLKISKTERQTELEHTVLKSPFTTDEEMASKFNVSIQTIRLDRLELGIPELRVRIKSVAKSEWKNTLKALPIEDVIGDIIDLQLHKRAISIFQIESKHVFSRNKIARGHHLFAQANSLAVAVINNQFAVTAKSEVKFIRQVHINEKIIAKAVIEDTDDKGLTTVKVESFVNEDTVFIGYFHMYHSSK